MRTGSRMLSVALATLALGAVRLEAQLGACTTLYCQPSGSCENDSCVGPGIACDNCQLSFQSWWCAAIQEEIIRFYCISRACDCPQ
jgi:hypothetical protein